MTNLLLRKVTILIAVLVILYFTLIGFIICCWHSETSLSVLAHLYELPASMFDRTGSQLSVIESELNKEADTSWVGDIVKKKDSLRNFDAEEDVDSNDLIIARKNESENKFFAYYLNVASCSSYVLRGCLYNTRWHIDKIYRTIHHDCNHEKSALKKTHFMLSEMHYFKSRYTAELNPEFWTNNWRIFKELKYASNDRYFEDKRPGLLNEYGNTCDFVVDFYKSPRESFEDSH